MKRSQVANFNKKQRLIGKIKVYLTVTSEDIELAKSSNTYPWIITGWAENKTFNPGKYLIYLWPMDNNEKI